MNFREQKIITLKNKNMKYRLLLVILLSMFIIPGLDAQKKAKKFYVSGIVTDATNTPVAGAMILIDNKYTNKVTDNKGFFKVKVTPDAQVISVVTPTAGIGEAIIDGETILNIKLGGVSTPQTAGQTGTKVNIGYGTIDKKDLTTPVNRLDNINSKYASYSNIYEVLKGTVPGVQVSGNKITIQGVNSINLSTQPLFIVDGVEVQSIDDIQPIMIESIEVLKGSSASIYGSRGANGVILIKLIGADSRR